MAGVAGLAGSKPKPIDWDLVDKYLEAGAEIKEVSARLKIDNRLFRSRLEKEKGLHPEEYRDIKMDVGNLRIRSTQYEKAVVHKDNDMLKWLGKHRLKQIEKQEKSVKIYDWRDIAQDEDEI